MRTTQDIPPVELDSLLSDYHSRILVRSKIRPKNGFFCYAPFLGLLFWVTFCSNSKTLTFDSKAYIWKNLAGVKFIVIVSWCSHKYYVQNIENPLL